MVKNIIGLLLGLSILGYGGYYSTQFAVSVNKAKPLFTSSNIDLSEEKWVQPVKPTVPVVKPLVSTAPARSTGAKGKGKKKIKKVQQADCQVSTRSGGRLRVTVKGAQLTCKKST